MPDQVAHWRKIRDIASSEIKSLVERQIISTSYQTFGNPYSKILLSLPSEKKAKGPINLGTILYDKDKWSIGISKNELMQNMVIFGRSGAGKTNVSFHLLLQLVEQKIPFLFLDWKRTARHLLPSLRNKINIYTPGRKLAGFPFNPFIVPPGVEWNVYTNQLIDVMADAFTLGDGAKSVVQKAITACYKEGDLCPTPEDILQKIEAMPEKERIRGWKITAIRALETLDYSGMITKDKISQEQLAQTLLNQNSVVELDALGQNSKKFLIPLLCFWLYSVKLSSVAREKLSFCIFIEEAHHVLYNQGRQAKESLVEMLLRQCREIGIGIVVIDQHPNLISSSVLGNTYTSICLNLKDPGDISKAAALSMVNSEDKHYFSMLPVGQGIVKMQDRWYKPFLVKFPLMNVEKGKITDEVISRYFRANQTGSGRKTSVPPKFNRFGQVPLFDNVLNEGAFVFLQDILTHPDDGVKQRYKRLGLSAGTGNRFKEQLRGNGWLETQVVDLGRTRKVLLRLTQQAQKALNLDNIEPQYGSLVHEYWKRFYAQRFQKQGYQVEFEVPRKSGRIDLVARKGSEIIAIEIETGKSDFIRNVKQDLAAKYDRIMVIATDKSAHERIEKQLAQTGLLIAGRIDFILVSE